MARYIINDTTHTHSNNNNSGMSVRTMSMVKSSAGSPHGFRIPPQQDGEARYMPKNSLRIGCLQKKSINIKGVVWEKRRVMLTEEELMFARVEDQERRLIDFIALEDIVEVKNCVHHTCHELLRVCASAYARVVLFVSWHSLPFIQ